MINNKESTKFKILQILRSQTSPVFGETLASEIDVSQVSVWKAIQAIVALDYGISSTLNGYQLYKDKINSIYQWEFSNNN